ncbi:MAG TPA: hypothetical protein DC017_03795, partial [Candidatus Wallbacteria bacterium]|nr:hypothetical protein [Candidatus Wallbacteria bacterium]
LHKDGNYIYFDFRNHVIFKDGVFVGIIGAGNNINARKIKEEALGKSEEIYKVVVDKARDVIYTVSPDGIVTSVNEFMKNVTGFSAEEVIGKQYLYFVHPDEIDYGVKIHEAIMRGENPPVIEMRFLKKSGDYLTGEFSITPLFYNGKLLGTLGIGRDITEKKENEANLKLALAKERQLNELKQHFISMVSHEFRTPLFLISGTTELLENGLMADAKDPKREEFKVIKDNIKRLSETLSNIVLLCSENHSELFDPKPVNVIELCSEIIKDVCQALKSEGRVELSYCEKISRVPDFCIDCKIMRHILTNLLSNAVKYSSNTADPVKFRVENSGNFIEFVISDKGIGIPENDMKNLFQNFMRASNAKNIKGTGIGLAIVKKFVNIHKGEIALESALGQGTRVSVKIPV